MWEMAEVVTAVDEMAEVVTAVAEMEEIVTAVAEMVEMVEVGRGRHHYLLGQRSLLQLLLARLSRFNGASQQRARTLRARLARPRQRGERSARPLNGFPHLA